MVSYEGMFILNPDLDGAVLEKEEDFIKNEIVKQLGEIVEAKQIGKRKLAYTVKKMREGVYFFINFSSKPDTIDKILKKVRLNANVLRAGIFRKEKYSTSEIRD